MGGEDLREAGSERELNALPGAAVFTAALGELGANQKAVDSVLLPEDNNIINPSRDFTSNRDEDGACGTAGGKPAAAVDFKTSADDSHNASHNESDVGVHRDLEARSNDHLNECKHEASLNEPSLNEQCLNGSGFPARWRDAWTEAEDEEIDRSRGGGDFFPASLPNLSPTSILPSPLSPSPAKNTEPHPKVIFIPPLRSQTLNTGSASVAAPASVPIAFPDSLSDNHDDGNANTTADEAIDGKILGGAEENGEKCGDAAKEESERGELVANESEHHEDTVGADKGLKNETSSSGAPPSGSSQSCQVEDEGVDVMAKIVSHQSQVRKSLASKPTVLFRFKAGFFACERFHLSRLHPVRHHSHTH